MSIGRPAGSRSQRFRRWAALVSALAIVVPLLGAGRRDERVLWLVAEPDATILHDLAERHADVRWVERGVVIVETAPAETPPAAWRARRLAVRPADADLGVLRGADVDLWRKPERGHAEEAAFLASHCVARIPSPAGEVWLLVAPANTWPEGVTGCHGGVVLAKHGVDPRSLIDAGPPAALAPYLALRQRPLDAGERRAVASISADSLLANLQRITLDPFGRPADRWVHNHDLENIYAPRVEAVMARAIAGIPGAQVKRQTFVPRLTTPTDSTWNVIARLPGSVPGTGTFVVCAHLDATGQRDPAWVAAMNAGNPIETPGAEDNGTGVACVLEMLRATADAIRRRAGRLRVRSRVRGLVGRRDRARGQRGVRGSCGGRRDAAPRSIQFRHGGLRFAGRQPAGRLQPGFDLDGRLDPRRGHERPAAHIPARDAGDR
jgi:hypothetical protein